MKVYGRIYNFRDRLRTEREFLRRKGSRLDGFKSAFKNTEERICTKRSVEIMDDVMNEKVLMACGGGTVVHTGLSVLCVNTRNNSGHFLTIWI